MLCKKQSSGLHRKISENNCYGKKKYTNIRPADSICSLLHIQSIFAIFAHYWNQVDLCRISPGFSPMIFILQINGILEFNLFQSYKSMANEPKSSKIKL